MMIEKIKEKGFLIFIAIGVVNTLNNWWISALCSLVLDANLSYAIGYAASLLIGFFLNCRLTFQEKPTLLRLGKYALSYMPNYLIQQGIVFVVVELLAWHKFIAYGAAAVIGMPVTYLILKVFAFAKEKRK